MLTEMTKQLKSGNKNGSNNKLPRSLSNGCCYNYMNICSHIKGYKLFCISLAYTWVVYYMFCRVCKAWSYLAVLKIVHGSWESYFEQTIQWSLLYVHQVHETWSEENTKVFSLHADSIVLLSVLVFCWSSHERESSRSFFIF